jgi:hypothetical protein
MAIESREKQIGDYTYRVTQFGAKQGRGLLVRMIKMAGPALGGALSALARGNKGEFEAAIASGLSQGIYELAERLTEAEFASVTDEMAKLTVVVLDGDKEPRLSGIFDDHFAGRYDEMLQWVAFVWEVNYGSFFGGSTDRVGMVRRLWSTLSASPSPSTSTGTSTASRPAQGIATAS